MEFQAEFLHCIQQTQRHVQNGDDVGLHQQGCQNLESHRSEFDGCKPAAHWFTEKASSEEDDRACKMLRADAF